LLYWTQFDALALEEQLACRLMAPLNAAAYSIQTWSIPRVSNWNRYQRSFESTEVPHTGFSNRSSEFGPYPLDGVAEAKDPLMEPESWVLFRGVMVFLSRLSEQMSFVFAVMRL